MDGVSLAISVHYDPEFMIAPVVLDVCGNLSYDSALGSARAGRVPICEDTPLARALEVSTPRGTFIPANLYWAVAKVLARVYRVHSRQLPLFPHERG
ncbi:MAG: EscU/YscU/HrcU family type III secretion system export apparatus switch protein [Nitrospirae bacterium]|nr:EscU/YscU/HrcU family type III secretion system export apparatus switch protein [Nitrospirota bacterium]